MARQMEAVKLSSNNLALMNAAFVCEEDFPTAGRIGHLLISSSQMDFVMTLVRNDQVKSGQFALGETQRKWAEMSVKEMYGVQPYTFQAAQYLASVTFKVNFHTATKSTTETYDTDEMAREFLAQFPVMALTKGQVLVFGFQGKVNLKLTVEAMTAIDLAGIKDEKSTNSVEPLNGVGISSPNMDIFFEREEKSPINLIGKSMARTSCMNILKADFNFDTMGVGGLDEKFSVIFRRAFASRLLPTDILDQLGGKHIRGILLFGPPGTGKTLIARQIGKMLNSREPQIVSGPSILDKFVGESEANIRKLFAPAEEEEKRLGPNSGLHIIIFDEIDAICKRRGSASGSTGVHDTIVNQLLAKMDGVDQLNNILVIGMTNRLESIDEALLRPGRMDVLMEIKLPDELGRQQILKIHTAVMKGNNRLATEVDVKELAAMTKNFSGAEIEGLVKAAQSRAIYRLVKTNVKMEVDPDAWAELLVSRDDFLKALTDDIKPAFGSNDDVLANYVKKGIIIWDECVQTVLDIGEGRVKMLKKRDAEGGLLTLLLQGPPNSGKTALATQICLNSGFPLVKVCSPMEMIGWSEFETCMAIKKMFDDAYTSEFSCLLMDDLEELIDYSRLGPRYSTIIVNCIRKLLKKNPPNKRKLLVVCTTSEPAMVAEVGLGSLFPKIALVRNISTPKHLTNILLKNHIFTEEDGAKIRKQLVDKKLRIGVKELLLLSESCDVDHKDFVGCFLENLESDGYIRPEASQKKPPN